jgi:hypothetical protein
VATSVKLVLGSVQTSNCKKKKVGVENFSWPLKSASWLWHSWFLFAFYLVINSLLVLS